MRAGLCTVSAPLAACSPAAALPPAARFLALHLLHQQTLYFIVQVKSRVRELYQQTCHHFAQQGMVDTDLFGLALICGRPMTFPLNKTITAVYGQPLTLTMEFCANPAYNRVFWIARNKIYFPGDTDNDILAYDITNTTRENCHQAVLYLNRVGTDDLGEYTLIVRSVNGLAEGVFTVNITYASGYNVPTSSGSPPGQLAAHYTHLFILLVISSYFID